MKFTVLKWLGDYLLSFIAKCLEITFRCLLFLLPLGVFMLILQGRSKVSSVSSLSAFTNDKSVWQHVFPGFMLVSVDQKQFRSRVVKVRDSIQSWIKENRSLLDALFMVAVVAVLVLLEMGK